MGIGQSKLAVARTKAVPAFGAMEVSPLEYQWPEDTHEGLASAPDVADQSPTAARRLRWVAIGVIGVQPLLYRLRRQVERLAADGCFQSFQIQFVAALAAQEQFDIAQDLNGEKGGERAFFLRCRHRVQGGGVDGRRCAQKPKSVVGPIGGNDDTRPIAHGFDSPPDPPESRW